MTLASFGGVNTSVVGNTDQWVHVPVSLPNGRNVMFSGTQAAIVTGMGAYVSGNGATRTVQLGFESFGYSSPFTVAASSTAHDTGGQPASFVIAATTDNFRISANGSFFFGRGTPASSNSTDSHGRTFTNSLYGYYTYVSAPTAPTSPSVTSAGSTSATVSWAAPSDNGDSPITGYRVDYSTSATFASNVSSVEVGNVTSYTVTGLAGTTLYYFRVFAENVVTAVMGTWSLPTSTVNLTSGTGGSAPTQTIALSATTACAFTYPTSSAGAWSFWMTQSTSSWFVKVSTVGTFGGAALRFGVDPSIGFWASTSTNANPIGDGPTYLPASGFPGTHRFSVAVGAVFASGTWTFPLTLYVDGVLTASARSMGVTPPSTFSNAARQPTTVQVGTYGTVGSAVLSRLSHTLTVAHEEYATQPTEAGYLSAAAAATSQVTLGALPANLSTVPVGYFASNSQSTLDALNAAIRTEQGYIDCVTSGTLTNPVQTVRVRGRDRPAAVTYSFDAQLEVSGGVDFLRDSTNLIWSDVVSGANSSSRTVSQPALQARAGSNNSSDTVITYRASDLYEFGTDRLSRGQNVALRPASISIDNVTLATDRSSDLLSMVPGDRIRITNIPSTTLGFTQWDGWLLDKQQTHRSGANAQDLFVLYLQPVMPDTGIYDTNLFMSGGVSSLNASITSGATSMAVLSADLSTYLEQVATPYTLQIDNEQVTVTACGAPSAGVQTVTITRAVNGTTAAAHSAGALVDVAVQSLYAY